MVPSFLHQQTLPLLMTSHSLGRIRAKSPNFKSLRLGKVRSSLYQLLGISVSSMTGIHFGVVNNSHSFLVLTVGDLSNFLSFE